MSITKEERKVKFLCPKCFKDSRIEVLKWPEPSSISVITDPDSNIKDLSFITEAWLTVKGKCECGYEGELIDIDEGFVELIQYLNENGYETIFCCEGHFIEDENIYDHPYLIFNCIWDDKTYAKILRHLPESWKIYRKPLDGFGFESEVRLYCKNYYKYPNCMNNLKEFIYKWFPKLKD